MSATNLEFLAIYWAIKQLKHYLYGVPFTVVCDHLPLRWMFRSKDSFNKIYRWRMELVDFQFVVVWKPGKTNISDPLSRYVS